ncbi:hypothetical protein CFL01nite_17200 [Corynebacterium flavescens]|uniref:Uncharacterized protein n=1 Tax=Corynebacterium flavescens TaxID=28028 RepID=A0AB73B8C3_CORFL|nr:hypothetical protein CFL01nite_17200 [Corynebacterium flavescens]
MKGSIARVPDALEFSIGGDDYWATDFRHRFAFLGEDNGTSATKVPKHLKCLELLT